MCVWGITLACSSPFFITTTSCNKNQLNYWIICSNLTARKCYFVNMLIESTDWASFELQNHKHKICDNRIQAKELIFYHSTSYKYIKVCRCFILQDHVFFGRKILCFHLRDLWNSMIETKILHKYTDKEEKRANGEKIKSKRLWICFCDVPTGKASHAKPLETSRPCPQESRKDNVKCLTEWLSEGNQECLAAAVPLNLSCTSSTDVQASDLVGQQAACSSVQNLKQIVWYLSGSLNLQGRWWL